MKIHVRFALIAVLTFPGTAGWGQGVRGARTLPSFRSDRELADYLRQAVDQRNQQLELAANCSGTVHTARHERVAPASSVILGHVTDVSGTPISGARLMLGPIGVGITSSSDGR